MIVWHLLSNRWNSAITEYALSAARALEAAGHKSVFTPLAGSPAAKRAAEAGLAVEPVSSFTITRLPALTQIARGIKPAVIMVYGGPETIISKALHTLTGAQIVRFRGQAVEGSSLVAATRQRLSLTHVEFLITPHRGLEQQLRSGLPGKRIETVILGCDTHKYRRVMPQAPTARPEVVLLGRLDPVKGHAPLFAIFAEMLRQWVRPARPRLHVVGEPANLTVSALRAEASSAGLKVDQDVVFTPARVDGIATLLSSAAVGVIPSIGSEVIARVAEEFLLCGTPIVVSGVGSLEEPLFEGAGASYRGMTRDRAAALLRAWIERSLDEGETAKRARAETAARHFSLETMGAALTQALRDRS